MNHINNLESAIKFLDVFCIDEPIIVFKEKLIKYAEKELYVFYSKHMLEVKDIRQLRIKAIQDKLFENWIDEMCWENKFILMYYFSLQNIAQNYVFNPKNQDVIGEMCRQFLINKACEKIIMG